MRPKRGRPIVTPLAAPGRDGVPGRARGGMRWRPDRTARHDAGRGLPTARGGGGGAAAGAAARPRGGAGRGRPLRDLRLGHPPAARGVGRPARPGRRPRVHGFGGGAGRRGGRVDDGGPGRRGAVAPLRPLPALPGGEAVPVRAPGFDRRRLGRRLRPLRPGAGGVAGAPAPAAHHPAGGPGRAPGRGPPRDHPVRGRPRRLGDGDRGRSHRGTVDRRAGGPRHRTGGGRGARRPSSAVWPGTSAPPRCSTPATSRPSRRGSPSGWPNGRCTWSSSARGRSRRWRPGSSSSAGAAPWRWSGRASSTRASTPTGSSSTSSPWWAPSSTTRAGSGTPWRSWPTRRSRPTGSSRPVTCRSTVSPRRWPVWPRAGTPAR